MASKVRWFGEYYARGTGKNATFRNRRTGEVLSNSPKVVHRKGNDRVIVPSSSRLIGVEKTKMHFSGRDKKPILLTGNKLKKLKIRVRENNPNAKKKRTSHSRTLR